MGLIRDDIRAEWRIPDPVGVAEIRLAVLCDESRPPVELKPLPAYPGVTRDIAFIVEESVTHGDVLRVVRAAAPRELTGVLVFDIFRGKAIGEGRKSLAYSLVYRSLERTLTDEEVNASHEVIREALKTGLKAEIRET